LSCKSAAVVENPAEHPDISTVLQARPDLDHPSFKVETRASEDVCVAFSSRDTAPGKFTFFKTLSNSRANVIYLNDYSNSWFLQGTPDFPDEVFFISWLRKQIDVLKAPSGKLTMIGASMGAYAALKYGAILGADRIFSLGPESELCIPLGRSITSISADFKGKGNIAGLEYKNPKDVLIISGSNDIVDLYSASRFQSCNPEIDVRLIRNRTHVVAKYLNAQFNLDNIVSGFLSKGDRSFLDNAETMSVPSLQEAHAMKSFNEKLANREVERCDELIIIKLADAFPQWSMPQHYAGLLFEASENETDAEQYFNRALVAQPSLGRSRLKLAQIFARGQRWTECVRLLEEQSGTAYTANIAKLLSEAYRALGNTEMAASAITKLAVKTL
jgi:tetratricopeptide (TPR) repeat protein